MENTTSNRKIHFNTIQDLYDMLGVTAENCEKALEQGYKVYPKCNMGVIRIITEPNELLNNIQKNLLIYLQENYKCPSYCMAGFKGQNNIKNAMRHRHKREVITTDISHYFSNTKEKYVRKFFEKDFGATGEVLELLVKLTTYKGYLPTGAPTSTILAGLVHQEIFETIYNKVCECSGDMTIYVDDITISTNGHIGNWIIKYIQNVLKTHGLFIKKSKTKRYGYKYAVVTGVHISQSGKLSAPFTIGHSVISSLKTKDLTEMTETELKNIIAKISYIQQFTKDVLNITKIRAIKQLKKISSNKQGEKNV